MIGGWLRKILETQISILILSLLIGILVRFDDLVFNWADSVGFGWAIALTIQIAIAIALFVNRNKIPISKDSINILICVSKILRSHPPIIPS